jgi:hypothetical protein
MKLKKITVTEMNLLKYKSAQQETVFVILRGPPCN